MNTLHMYHWRDIATLENNLMLLGMGDSLVIFGSLSEIDIKQITYSLKDIAQPWYVVNNNNHPHISARQIKNEKWLDLIINHRITLTWK